MYPAQFAAEAFLTVSFEEPTARLDIPIAFPTTKMLGYVP